MKNKSSIRSLALCGVFAALAITIMTFGGTTVLDMSLLVVCSLMTMLLIVEVGVNMTWVYVAVTSTLAFIVLPVKLYALEYTVFSALYPILKLYLERLPTVISYILKIASLDVMLVVCILVGQYVFAVGDEFFTLGFVTLILGTMFFILYDVALTKCISLYLLKLRKKLFPKK